MLPRFSFLARTMPDADDIRDAAAEAATGPKSATVDGNTYVGRDLKELHDAANREAGREAVTTTKRGLVFTKLRSPGAN
jgi:hypothetical protein